MGAVLWVSALLVACCSAYYSVFGLSQLFSGAAFAVVIMASSLEFAKLIAVSFLQRYWKVATKVLKIYLTIAVVVLMSITSAGVYGFLSSAYSMTANKLTVADSEVSILEAKKKTFEDKRKELSEDVKLKESRIKSLTDIRMSQEGNLSRAYSGSRRVGTRSLQGSINGTEKTLQDAFNAVESQRTKMQAMTDSMLSYDVLISAKKNSDVSAELGPLRYLSRLTGYSMDVVINWFILLIVCVFDPLAVALVLAANFITKSENDNALFEVEKGGSIDEVISNDRGSDDDRNDQELVIDETAIEDTSNVHVERRRDTISVVDSSVHSDVAVDVRSTNEEQNGEVGGVRTEEDDTHQEWSGDMGGSSTDERELRVSEDEFYGETVADKVVEHPVNHSHSGYNQFIKIK